MTHRDYLRGERLRLRAVEPADACYMYSVENDPSQWIGSDITAPMSAHVLRDYAETYDADPIRSGQLRLMAEEKATGRTVGIIDLYRISPIDRSAMTGIYVDPSVRRQGYGHEMLCLIEAYARDILCLHQLNALVLTVNAGSRLLFEGAGYSHTATLRDWKRAAGRYYDVAVYQCLLEDVSGGETSDSK